MGCKIGPPNTEVPVPRSASHVGAKEKQRNHQSQLLYEGRDWVQDVSEGHGIRAEAPWEN